MVLSDRDIRNELKEELVIDPLNESNIEPASVDLLLGEDFKITSEGLHSGMYSDRVVSLSDDDDIIWKEQNKCITLDPDEFALATTKEHVKIPTNMVAHVLGRSSLGRLGISVHQTAGYIDPGFEGQITLELSNHGPAPVSLQSGQRICQIVFEYLSSEAEQPYGHSDSQYQNQSGATTSGMNFD